MIPLVGRAPIMSSLVGHLDATVQGRSNCLIIDGPFGIGKTDLLKAAGAEGAERGLTVVAARAGTTDQPTPIHLLITYLRHVIADESDLNDLISPDTNPFWLMDRVGELVESAARRHPVVVVLDDAQRIDDVSALALRGLVQSLASSPVLWLLARRSIRSQSLAQHAVDWLTDHAAARLHLGALDDEAVAELCRSILGAKPDSSVLRWAARCGGNPWLVKSTFSALLKAGQMIILDGTASVAADRLPEGVLTAVRGLLDDLSPAARRLLVTGRRIGLTFTVEEVTALLGEPGLDLWPGVDEAVNVGLIRRQGTELTFIHEVIGEVLQLAAARERGTATTVPAIVPPPGRLAVAPVRTGAVGAGIRVMPGVRPLPVSGLRNSPVGLPDTRAERPSPAPPAATSGAAPSTRSPGCACEHLTARAMSSLESLDDAPEALATALRLLAGAGRGEEARRLTDVALRRDVEAAAEAQLVLELGQGLRDVDSHGMVAELLQRTLARPDVCELDRARLNQLLAETAKRAGDVAGPVPRPNRRPPATAHRCGAHERPLWTWLIRALVATDRFGEATAALAGVRQEAEKLGDRSLEPLWYGHRAELLLAAGQLEGARLQAESALRLAGPSVPEDSIPARLVLARISIHRGDLATASDQMRMTERLMTGEATADQARLDWTLAQFHAASARPAMTVQSLLDIDGQVEADRLLFAEAPTAAATLIREAREMGLGAEAERAAEFARRMARRNPVVQSLAAGAEHAEGLLRNDPVSLRRAAELYRLAGRPLAAASALEDTARVEQGLRDKAQAVRLLESAMDLYLDCGAQSDLDRVQKKLGRLGTHNVRRLAAERPKSGWESLTTAELRVVRAIVDGRTNREAASALFLSPHTVDTHLRRVFSKLDINSRVELTRRFITQESSPPGDGGHASDCGCSPAQVTAS